MFLIPTSILVFASILFYTTVLINEPGATGIERTINETGATGIERFERNIDRIKRNVDVSKMLIERSKMYIEEEEKAQLQEKAWCTTGIYVSKRLIDEAIIMNQQAIENLEEMKRTVNNLKKAEAYSITPVKKLVV